MKTPKELVDKENLDTIFKNIIYSELEKESTKRVSILLDAIYEKVNLAEIIKKRIII